MQGMLFADNGRLSVLLVTVCGVMTASFYMEEFLEKEKFISSFFGRFLYDFFFGSGFFGVHVILIRRRKSIRLADSAGTL